MITIILFCLIILIIAIVITSNQQPNATTTTTTTTTNSNNNDNNDIKQTKDNYDNNTSSNTHMICEEDEGRGHAERPQLQQPYLIKFSYIGVTKRKHLMSTQSRACSRQVLNFNNLLHLISGGGVQEMYHRCIIIVSYMYHTCIIHYIIHVSYDCNYVCMYCYNILLLQLFILLLLLVVVVVVYIYYYYYYYYYYNYYCMHCYITASVLSVSYRLERRYILSM